ncbi:MAG: VacJ family lipoprotein, partial [Deltaproteobacteria bacterium]|nr:VacJ family lipoprotein [Deltaproteobacteria bacterium]
MTARSLLQAFVGLVVIGTSPFQAAAEQPPPYPQTAEAAEETPSETDPAASSQAEAVESEPNDATTESFFADEPDPLFDDDDVFELSRGYPDPLEEPNRAVFGFNRGLDTYLIGPIASFFGYVTPAPLKRGLRNFFANLNAPVVVVNDMLQLEWIDAVVCTSAFVVNTTVGIVGFFEPAKHIGLPRHESDFGQTLALARVPSGPYLILPIAGPSTARGTVGSLVDFFMRPNTWL